MIHEDSLNEKWIKDIAKQHRSDPIIVEKVVRALYLLEQLQMSGLEFIFKGGTALMLLLKEPKRFSIDIDIIVSKKSNKIKEKLDFVLQKSDFEEYKIDERQIKSKIEKEHFKFYYKPETNARAELEYILLDVLYEESHYDKYVYNIEIESPFIKSKNENVKITVPLPEAILGDKLTAFAPNTTGIQYGRGKEVEIIKQLFDVGHLIDMAKDVTIVSEVFKKFAKTELEYRELKALNESDVLNDVFQTALLMSTRGQSGVGNYQEIQKGIRNIKNYIFSENFHIERAIIAASKAAYLATLLQTDETKVDYFTNPTEVKDWNLQQPFDTRLNKLKKSNPEAFFYWYKVSLIFENKIIILSKDEISLLIEPIERYQHFEGPYSRSPALYKIIDKLNQENLRLNGYTTLDLSILLAAIENEASFKHLTKENPIFNIKNKIEKISSKHFN